MTVFLLGGFFGSGKTSLLKRIIEELSGTNATCAVVENEIGNESIDDKALSGSVEVVTVLGACICCQVSGSLVEAINIIREQINPKYLFIELTGMAFPYNALNTLRQLGLTETCKVISIVDATRADILCKYYPEIFQSQIKDADVIIVSKTDLQEVSKEILNLCREKQASVLISNEGSGIWEKITKALQLEA